MRAGAWVQVKSLGILEAMQSHVQAQGDEWREIVVQEGGRHSSGDRLLDISGEREYRCAGEHWVGVRIFLYVPCKLLYASGDLCRGGFRQFRKEYGDFSSERCKDLFIL